MATTNFKITKSAVDIAEYENYSAKDQALIDSLQVNSLFDAANHFIELHIYSLDGTRLHSDYSYTGHKQLLNSAGAGKSGASNLYIDPIADCEKYGYAKGGVKLLYHFLDNLFSEDNSKNFYIESISTDRTEVRLLSTKFTDEELVNKVQELQVRFAEDPYFNEFRLNLGKNDLFIGINLDIETYQGRSAVLVKLYEALPTTYTVKDILYIVEFISDSVQYEVESTVILDKQQNLKLKGPNFNLDIAEESIKPTAYFNYNELFSYPVTGSYHELYSIANEKGINLSIDYSNFEEFIHFSSAEDRLSNFAYKLNLIQDYETQLAAKQSSTSGASGISGSKLYYESLITNIVSNFDGYERYLYYSSGSKAWPKTNSEKPYINATTASAATWYSSELASASLFDLNNTSGLQYALPEFLKENPDNALASTFLNMIGQHFDTLWIYAKAVTDKYDADNRLNYGISRDLVEDALKNFGVKLYTSNYSTENLFGMFLGEAFADGSGLTQYLSTEGGNILTTEDDIRLILVEGIDQFVSASNSPDQPVPYIDYQQEIYKRIYHNLPYLIKTKGTERGVRALINCFGIPSTVLSIDEFGGYNRNSDFYYGYQIPVSQSLDKIRLDNTGSIVDTTLSKFTSIQKPDEKFNQDLHILEVGFTPAESLNNYIDEQLQATYPTWSLDDYIGDYRDKTARSYADLDKLATAHLEDINRYDLIDFVRIIKFFDNTLFKMIKDFVPARTTTSTGIIIKPHILDRSKIQAPNLTLTQHEYSGSIDTAFLTGSDGGVLTTFDTTHTNTLSTASGSITKTITNQQARYTGELGGTVITATDKDLNSENSYKVSNASSAGFSYSEYEVLENNATVLRNSTTLHPLDTAASKLLPTNINYILSGSDIYASVQDSNYSTGFANSRYIGKQLRGAILNQYSVGDISFGLEPVITYGQTYFAYFNWVGGTSPEWGNHLKDRSAANLRFLIDLEGNVISPSKDFDGVNQSIVEQNFSEGSYSKLALESNANATFYSLNGEWKIFKSGKRVEPIVYTQKAIFNTAGNTVIGFDKTGSINFFDFDNPVNPAASLDFRMVNYAAADQTPVIGNVIEFGTPNVLGAEASWSSGGNSWTATGDPTPGSGVDYTLTYFFTLTSSPQPVGITYAVQKYDGANWTTVKSVYINHATSYLHTVTYTDTTVNTGDRFRLYVEDIDDLQYSVTLTTATSFRVLQSPLPASNATNAFWVVDANRQYVSASDDTYGLNKYYGQFQKNIPDSGFNDIKFPFEPEVYDELRFEGSETLSFQIQEVTFSGGVLILKLDREVPVGTDTDYFLLRRYVDDPSYVILEVDKPAGATPGGTLRPKFMPNGAEKKIETIIKDLKSKNLI